MERFITNITPHFAVESSMELDLPARNRELPPIAKIKDVMKKTGP